MGKEPRLSWGAKQECKTSKARLKLRARGERYFLEATVINIRIFSVFENFPTTIFQISTNFRSRISNLESPVSNFVKIDDLLDRKRYF